MEGLVRPLSGGLFSPEQKAGPIKVGSCHGVGFWSPLFYQDAGSVRHAEIPPGSSKEEPGDAGERAGFERVDGTPDREGHHHH